MKPILITIFLCIQLFSAKAQSGLEVVYDFCTDTPVTSSLYSCLADTNQFFVVGGTMTLGVSSLHSTLASFDYQGNMLWYKKLFFPGQYNSSAGKNLLLKLDTNKYVVAALELDYSINTTKVIWQPFMFFFKKNGDSIRFVKLVDSFQTRYFNSIVNDGKYIITAGGKFSKAGGTVALWLCKFDTTGNLIWEKEYLNTEKDINDINITKTNDGYYIVSGSMKDTSIHLVGSCYMKFDTSGNIVWLKSLKKQYQSYSRMDIATNPGGGYYFVSSVSRSATMAPDSSFIYYGKLDEKGDTLWTKDFRKWFYNCEGIQIKWTSDYKNLIILVGAYSSTQSGVLKIDTLGNPIWYTIPSYFSGGKKMECLLNAISMTPDNRCLLAGATYTGHGTDNMSWMIVLDTNGIRYPNDPGLLPLGIKTMIANNNFKIWPNPVKEQLFVSNTANIEKLELFDLEGRRLIESQPERNSCSIDVSLLSPGVYILRINDTVSRCVIKN